MALAGALEVQMSMDLARLRTDVRTATQTIGGMARDIDRSISAIKTSFATLAGGLSISAIALFAKHVLDSAEELNKMSQKVGISVEELSKLKFAAAQSDVSLEALGKGIKTLSQQMVEANDKTSKSGKIMAELGVNLKAGVNPAIEQIAETFKALPDGPTKAALAVQLFGKAGMDMIPLLNQGADGIRKMKDEATRLGLVMSQDVAEAAEQFNDSLKTLKFQSEAAAATILGDLLKGMNRITAAMIEATREGGLLQKILVGIGGVMAEGIGLNDDQAKRNEKYIAGLKDARDGLKEMQKAGAELLPGEMAHLQALEREIADYDRMKAAIKDAAAVAAPAAKEQTKSDTDKEARIQKLLNAQRDLTKEADKYIATLERELLASGDLYQADKKYQQVLVDVARMKKDGIPIDEKRALQLADEIDKTKRLAEANAFLTAERQKDIDAAQNSGDALERLVNSLDDEAEQMELEAKLIGATNVEREKAILLLRKQGDLTAAAANPQAIRDIEAAYDRMFRAIDNKEFGERQIDIWRRISDASINFFTDLFQHGKSAFGRLWDEVKHFFAQLAALLATRWVLQIGANIIGGAAGQALSTYAGGVGGNSLAGSVIGYGADAAASYFGYTGVGTLGEFYGAATGAIPAGAIGADAVAAGVGTDTLAAGMGEWMAGLSATGWGLIIVAAVAVLTYFFSKDRGGPKAEGSFTGTFGDNGFNQATGQNPFYYATHNADEAMMKVGDQIAKGFAATLGAFGVSAKGFELSGGIVKDPQGDSPTFLDLLLKSPEGKILLQQHNADVGRSDEDLQKAMSLQWQRAALAALQASDLPGVLKDIFNTVDAETATAEQLNQVFSAATAEQQRFAGQWMQFLDMFSTGPEKVQMATQAVASGFEALGLAVPANSEAFKELVKSIDTSTTEGRKLFDSLMQLAPAFKFLEDSAAALRASFEQAASQINPSFGTGLARSKLESAAAAWKALDPGNNFSIQQIIDFVGGGGSPEEAWARAQALGGNATQVITDLYQAYAAWKASADSSSTAVSDFGSTIVDATGPIADLGEAAKKSLGEFLKGLLTGPLSPLDPKSQLNAAQSRFYADVALAKAGDVGAMGRVQGEFQDFLQIAQSLYKSGPQYADIFKQGYDALANLAGVPDYNQQMINGQATANLTLQQIRDLLISIRDRADANADDTITAVQQRNRDSVPLGNR